MKGKLRKLKGLGKEIAWKKTHIRNPKSVSVEVYERKGRYE